MLVLTFLVLALVIGAIKAGIEARMFSDLAPEEVKGSALPSFFFLSVASLLLLAVALFFHAWSSFK